MPFAFIFVRLSHIAYLLSMPKTKTFWWTPAPFLRLLPLLMLGIAFSWYCAVPAIYWLSSGVTLFILPLLYSYLPVAWQYRLRYLTGAFLLFLPFCLGGWLVAHHDIRNSEDWFGKQYRDGGTMLVTLAEELVAKPRSYKAVAQVQYIINGKKAVPVKGSAILYFKKDSMPSGLRYGARLLLRKPLQVIQNSGNPGAFDYQRYCLFGGITHQVFLTQKDYLLLPGNSGKAFDHWLIKSRSAIVAILRRNIEGVQEQGLAEALLIGYKEDLDKSLVQAYANTGVVHVIAISGLHLGLIYGLLVLLLRPLKKRARLIRFCVIVAGLWAFAFLAGAQPSVLRSALMFSCMALGELVSRRSSSFNTLALSAFLLLCFNPFWLWDLGFQLSYAALCGILLFYKPLYRALYFPNKAFDFVWQMAALTLTAQVFTLPISLYYFHQFPVLFLITNLLAVPLSSLILLGEILLCLIAFITPLAAFIGKMLYWLILFMNRFILRLDGLAIAVWDGFSLSGVQVALLYLAIGFGGYWLLHKRKSALLVSLCWLLLFMVLHSYNMWQIKRQQHLIVYNVPRHRAVDYVAGGSVYFLGDVALLRKGFEQDFHLKPARTLMRAKNIHPIKATMMAAGGKTIGFLGMNQMPASTLPDVLIVSGKAAPPALLPPAKSPFQVVLDATVPPYRRRQWQHLAQSGGWRLHDVQANGAFVMKW